MQERRVPGESLSQRLGDRFFRRFRLGFSPAFYLRLGLDDPWLPDGPVGGQDRDLDLVYVSAAPYYLHLRRLAWARRRREERLLGLASRFGQVRLRAVTRRWPGEAPARLAALGSFGVTEMVLPQPAREAPAQPEEDGGGRVSAWGRRHRGPTARPVVSAWLSREHEPARVFHTPKRPAVEPAAPAPRPAAARIGGDLTPAVAPGRQAPLPAERVGRRLAVVVEARSPVTRVIEQVSAPVVRRVRRPAEVIEEIVEAPATRRRRVVRQAARRLGPAGRLVQQELEDLVPEARVSPASWAAGRMAPRGPQRGLRPAMRHSPLASAARPAVAVEVQQRTPRALTARAPRTAVPRASTGRAPVAVVTAGETSRPRRRQVALAPAGADDPSPGPSPGPVAWALARTRPAPTDRLAPLPVALEGEVAPVRLSASPIGALARRALAMAATTGESAPLRSSARLAARVGEAGERSGGPRRLAAAEVVRTVSRLLAPTGLVYPQPTVAAAEPAAPTSRAVSAWGMRRPAPAARPLPATAPEKAPRVAHDATARAVATTSRVSPDSRSTPSLSGPRPAASAARRLDAVVAARSPALRVVEQVAAPSARGARRVLAAVQAAIEAAPGGRRAAVRQAARRLGPLGRAVQQDLEDLAPDARVSPDAWATGRMAPAGGQRGLRPALWRSPLVQAAPVSESEAVVPAIPDRRSRRAAAAVGLAPAPVAAPRPVARALARTRPAPADRLAPPPFLDLREADRQAVAATPTSAVVRRTRATLAAPVLASLAASARIAARLDVPEAAEPRVSGPRRLAAAAPVRTVSGLFAPASLVFAQPVVPAEAPSTTPPRRVSAWGARRPKAVAAAAPVAPARAARSSIEVAPSESARAPAARWAASAHAARRAAPSAIEAPPLLPPATRAARVAARGPAARAVPARALPGAAEPSPGAPAPASRGTGLAAPVRRAAAARPAPSSARPAARPEREEVVPPAPRSRRRSLIPPVVSADRVAVEAPPAEAPLRRALQRTEAASPDEASLLPRVTRLVRSQAPPRVSRLLDRIEATEPDERSILPRVTRARIEHRAAARARPRPAPADAPVAPGQVVLAAFLEAASTPGRPADTRVVSGAAAWRSPAGRVEAAPRTPAVRHAVRRARPSEEPTRSIVPRPVPVEPGATSVRQVRRRVRFAPPVATAVGSPVDLVGAAPSPRRRAPVLAAESRAWSVPLVGRSVARAVAPPALPAVQQASLLPSPVPQVRRFARRLAAVPLASPREQAVSATVAAAAPAKERAVAVSTPAVAARRLQRLAASPLDWLDARGAEIVFTMRAEDVAAATPRGWRARPGPVTYARSTSSRFVAPVRVGTVFLEPEPSAVTAPSAPGTARVVSGWRTAPPPADPAVATRQSRPVQWLDARRAPPAAPSASTAQAFRTPAREWTGAQAYRTPSRPFGHAPVVRTPDGEWVGAGVFRTPAGDWAGARAFRTPAGDWAGAPVYRTPGSTWGPGPRLGRLTARLPDGRYTGARQYRSGSLPADFVVPAPPAGPEAPPAPTGRVVSGWGRPRTPLPWTLGEVGSGGIDPAMPTWAQRAAGEPLVRGTGGDFIAALARADAPEEVVRVIMERGAGLGPATAKLPRPVIEVIRQIRAEAASAAPEASQAPAAPSAGAGAIRPRSAPPRSTTRVIRGYSGLRATASAQAAPGVGADRVMKLAQKLQQLIHLAEFQRRRDEARQQVRMAEDSAAGRTAVRGASPQKPGGAKEDQIDIEALGREVLEVATRELEMRRERRQEEGDGRDNWW